MVYVFLLTTRLSFFVTVLRFMLSFNLPKKFSVYGTYDICFFVLYMFITPTIKALVRLLNLNDQQQRLLFCKDAKK